MILVRSGTKDMKGEGCCVERATGSDYIHNQMSKLTESREVQFTVYRMN